MASSNQHRNKDEYIAQMERELSKLRSEVAVSKARGHGKRTKADIIKFACMSQKDVMLTERVWSFCKEYLFPRIKFLPKGWKVYDQNNRTNFAALMEKHVTIDEDDTFEGEWHRIIINAMNSKYIDLRCNVNNQIRETFKGEYCIIACCVISIIII
jgi:hypothetical protein